MEGLIHSRESFGTVDGPGIRYVLFLQGCPLRCLYCHNPDTWQTGVGERVTPSQLMAEFDHNRAFYKKGGITVSGGEPLLQAEFVTELFQAAKKKGVHTCLDTSAAPYSPENGASAAQIETLLQYTDLVLLDVKHMEEDAHRRLTGASNRRVLAFARLLEQKKIPVWIRHVVIPGYTDDSESLQALGHFAGSLRNLQALDVIPYHTLGVEKYRQMGLAYPLEGVAPLTAAQMAHAKAVLLAAAREARQKLR
ncbi:MAG: pyruvate formate lyase-activating protein [Clostridia bacterium]|nr:pyruvate formate lyase-activating protein [Clostridia bacterium]